MEWPNERILLKDKSNNSALSTDERQRQMSTLTPPKMTDKNVLSRSQRMFQDKRERSQSKKTEKMNQQRKKLIY